MKKENTRLLISGFLIALSIALALNMTSCISQKRVDKICQTCPTETIIKDSIRTVEKETIVYKAGALDSLMWVSTLDFSQFLDTIYKTDTIIEFKDNTWQISLLRGDNNKLRLFATHQADSIKELHKLVDNTNQSVKVQTVVKTVEKIVPKHNRWYYFLLIWFICSIVIIIAVVWAKWNIIKLRLFAKHLN